MPANSSELGKRMVDEKDGLLAYLVIREGSKWTDVFRLTPGRTVTIGRAATNQIVIKDERCSRNHAEIFMTGGQWTLRDLESRNGTVVGGKPIRGDYSLTPGDVVRIAHCQLAFVHDLSKAFLDASRPWKREPGEETVVGTLVSEPVRFPGSRRAANRRPSRIAAARPSSSSVPTGGAGNSPRGACRDPTLPAGV